MVAIRVGTAGEAPPRITVGSTDIQRVFVGGTLVWQYYNWIFSDDFNRSTLGTAWTSTGGAVLVNGQLKKNTTAGSSDNWTVQTFPSDNLHVRATIGEVTDPVQVSSIVLGSPSQYIYFEFAPNGGQIGDYNGSQWINRASVPAQPWAAGDRVEVIRAGTSVALYRNGAEIARGTSSVAVGASYRRVNLSVRVYVGGSTRYYSPTFDDVKVRVYS